MSVTHRDPWDDDYWTDTRPPRSAEPGSTDQLRTAPNLADAHEAVTEGRIAPTANRDGAEVTWNGRNSIGSPDGRLGQVNLPRVAAQAGRWQRTSDDGTTSDSRGANVEAMSGETIDNLHVGPGVQVQNRGPDAQAVASVTHSVTPQGGHDDSAQIGAQANLASTNVRVGNEMNNVRFGVSAGVGFGARGHMGDTDNDGRHEIGFGVDIGPVSIGANVELEETPQDRRVREFRERENAWAADQVRTQMETERAAQEAHDARIGSEDAAWVQFHDTPEARTEALHRRHPELVRDPGMSDADRYRAQQRADREADRQLQHRSLSRQRNYREPARDD